VREDMALKKSGGSLTGAGLRAITREYSTVGGDDGEF